MFKKSIAALFVGTAVLMTACGGNAATTAPAAEAPAASTETAPEAAETAASVPAEAAGTEERAAAQIETELTDGVLTIRLDGGPQKDGFYWEYYTGDKGDATFVELITQANDDGCAYAGSFKAIEDAGDAEDYIRLAYTNGTYVYEYTDVNVKIENSQPICWPAPGRKRMAARIIWRSHWMRPTGLTRSFPMEAARTARPAITP